MAIHVCASRLVRSSIVARGVVGEEERGKLSGISLLGTSLISIFDDREVRLARRRVVRALCFMIQAEKRKEDG